MDTYAKDVKEIRGALPALEAVVQRQLEALAQLPPRTWPKKAKERLTPTTVNALLTEMAQQDRVHYEALLTLPMVIQSLVERLANMSPELGSVATRFQRLRIPAKHAQDRAVITLGVYRGLETLREQQMEALVVIAK